MTSLNDWSTFVSPHNDLMDMLVAEGLLLLETHEPDKVAGFLLSIFTYYIVVTIHTRQCCLEQDALDCLSQVSHHHGQQFIMHSQLGYPAMGSDSSADWAIWRNNVDHEQLVVKDTFDVWPVEGIMGFRPLLH